MCGIVGWRMHILASTLMVRFVGFEKANSFSQPFCARARLPKARIGERDKRCILNHLKNRIRDVGSNCFCEGEVSVVENMTESRLKAHISRTDANKTTPKPHSAPSTPAFKRHPVTVNNEEKNDALLQVWVPRAFGVAFQLPTFGHGLLVCATGCTVYSCSEEIVVCIGPRHGSR